MPNLETLKLIASSRSHDEFLEITYPDLILCLQQYFPQLVAELNSFTYAQDLNFYNSLKKLAESYQSVLFCLQSSTNEENSILGAEIGQKHEGELQIRKNTRAAFAMRNSKNQEDLKKDQIFVRLIPRTHNCIHFMVKNHNFPRIECKLSCNQHLEYLITYLTNKWLRGKVGVGYQIKLYPDPSTYMHKNGGDGKRPTVVHEALNNYFMFTDVMAAFGVTQNGCINLLYDITELRKEKEKQRDINLGLNIPLTTEKVSTKISKLPEHHYEPSSSRYSLKKEDKNSFSKQEEPLKSIYDHQDDLSIGIIKEKGKYGNNNNSIDYSEVNSIGYQFNTFNSNHVFTNLFNMNNSNTYLGVHESQKDQFQVSKGNDQSFDNDEKEKKEKEEMFEEEREYIEEKEEKESKEIKNINKTGTQCPANIENKLENIRNIISIIEKETIGNKNEIINNPNDKEENSMNKIENHIKKEIKTVSIIKKKNQSDKNEDKE